MDFYELLRSLVFSFPTQSTHGGTKDQRSNPQQASWLDTRHFFFWLLVPYEIVSLVLKGAHCTLSHERGHAHPSPFQVTSIYLNPQGGPYWPHTGVFAFANRIFFLCLVAELWARINTDWWNPPGSALLEKGKVALRSPLTMLRPD